MNQQGLPALAVDFGDERARERAAVIRWARKVLANPRTVFFDTETTGLGPDAEIVDLAVVGHDGTTIIDALVRPGRPIPAEASNIHGLYDHHVEMAPGWEAIYPHVREALKGRLVVVYNADYDRGMVGNGCLAHNLPLITCDWNCAMRQYAQFAGERAHRESNEYRWHKLERALAAFGLVPGGHSALGDAEACRRLVMAIAQTRF
jgi:DNA polymerase III subunit epsilon